MESRFFLANLQLNIKEEDLRNLFQDYGEVVRVELKTKDNLVDPEKVKVLAFVTVKLFENDAQYCINELNWQKVNGEQISVSLAKESFLDRLKRERQEAEAVVPANTYSNNNYNDVADRNTSVWLRKKQENTRKTFSEDYDFNADDIALNLLITKKRAASSLHNGKIVIQSYDTTPLHVIESKRPNIKQLDARSQSADQKRKESLNKMKNQYQLKKNVIQQALTGVDQNVSKKIKFSDAEDGEVAEEETRQAEKSETKIFGSDNEDDDVDNMRLDLKPDHFGKKGAKLLQIQSQQSLDPRFKINANFVDDDDDDDDDDSDEDNEGTKTNANKKSDDGEIENERTWQMGILEQVVGTKFDTSSDVQKLAKNKKMLRYDPLKDEDKKFLRSQSSNIKEIKQKQKSTKQKDVNLEITTNEKVEGSTTVKENSKQVFYFVTNTLKQSLNTSPDGFSLLSMFGNQSELKKRENQLIQLSNEKILVNKTDANVLNPFTYDSSSDSDDGNTFKAGNASQCSSNVKETSAINAKNKKKVKIAVESFFIPKTDVRIKEGANFFKYNKSHEPEQDYEEVRNRLKLLIKTKITKTKKNLLASGISVNHRGHKRKRI